VCVQIWERKRKRGGRGEGRMGDGVRKKRRKEGKEGKEDVRVWEVCESEEGGRDGERGVSKQEKFIRKKVR